MDFSLYINVYEVSVFFKGWRPYSVVVYLNWTQQVIFLLLVSPGFSYQIRDWLWIMLNHIHPLVWSKTLGWILPHSFNLLLQQLLQSFPVRIRLISSNILRVPRLSWWVSLAWNKYQSNFVLFIIVWVEVRQQFTCSQKKGDI